MSDASLSAKDEAALAGVPRGKTESPFRRSDCVDCGEPLDSMELETGLIECYSCYRLRRLLSRLEPLDEVKLRVAIYQPLGGCFGESS